MGVTRLWKYAVSVYNYTWEIFKKSYNGLKPHQNTRWELGLEEFSKVMKTLDILWNSPNNPLPLVKMRLSILNMASNLRKNNRKYENINPYIKIYGL